MTRHHPSRQDPIAIVGLSALMPGSATTAGFWRTIIEGRDLVREVPPGHWPISEHFDPDPSAPDKTYGRRGAFLDPVDFDPLAFGIPPSALPATDTSQLLALLVAGRLLADVERHGTAARDRDRVGVILGATPLELLTTMAHRLQRPVWAKALRESGLSEDRVQDICDRIAAHYPPWQEATFPGLLSNVVAGRIANRFDLHGPNLTTDAACASSLAALATAVNELNLHRADMVITGGVDTSNDVMMYTCFSKTPALSPTGDCRPFATRSDGTILGEGVVMFALKRLTDAERDGDTVHALIRGIGASSDGRGAAVYTPVPDGQARALRRAYQTAGYGPGTVELVEAHGTGTPAGDAAEVAALRQVFAEDRTGADPWCALGSIKSQIGHTKAAAGAAGLLKAVLSLSHAVLPPTIKAERPHPRLGLETGPFRLSTAARPWVRGSSHPRRASVSSFGFGGSNFHVAVEEYRPQAAGRRPGRLRAAPSELVPFVGASVADLLSECDAVTAENASFHEIVWKAQRACDPRRIEAAGARLAIIAADGDDLQRKLLSSVSRIKAGPELPFAIPDGAHYRCRPHRGLVAFLFPGQGSQYVSMGADLAMHMPRARQVWDDASDLRLGDRPLHELVFPHPALDDEERTAQAAALTATEWAQPAIAVHSMALLSVLAGLGLRPDCAAGHSMGELTALHAAGVLDAASLTHLARRRGELIRATARKPGGMLVAHMSHEAVAQAIVALGAPDLWPVNHNAPEQTVVAGGTVSVQALHRALVDRGGRARLLDVSDAFHSPLVRDATEPLAEFLSGLEITGPRCEVLATIDARPYPSDPDGIRLRLARQLASPVHFAAQVRAMYDRGVRTFVEVGPSSVLTGLVDANLGDRPHLAVSLDRRGFNGVTSLHEALAQLVVHGIPLSLESLWKDYEPPEPEAAAGSPATVQICGTNFDGSSAPAGDTGAVDLFSLRSGEPPGGATPRLNIRRSSPGRPDMPAPESARSPDHAPEATLSIPQVPEIRTLGTRQTGGDAIPASGADQLHVLQEAQQLAAQVQNGFQRAMSDALVAFLAFAHECITCLESDVVKRAAVPRTDHRPAVFHEDPAAQGAAANGGAHALTRVPTQLASTQLPSQEQTASVPSAAPKVAEPYPAGESWSAAAPQPMAGLETMMINVVADKTGYPADMLTPSMHLQTDLGIDSIKRVEILSALRERVPDLPTLSTAELGALETLGEIVDRLGAVGGGSDGARTAPSSGTAS
ncbi:beta-ketoacyl synthase N-terminal-like domain-containing protein [Spirillospora sp. NPDC048911]|uniref:beta-ketoacyl synthase N-terminal-like domain-containing protein n=1 Tax=Spirillospora sp. NPDC048911 TaxID=3364527 RepID=UPI00371F7E3F